MAKKKSRSVKRRPSSTTRPSPLVFPELAPVYNWAEDFAYPLLRVTIGLMLLVHGWPKLFTAGLAGVTASMTRLGLEPATLFAFLLILLETAGAIMIAIGLFTRPAALLIVIEFLVIIFFVHWPNGYGGPGGIEFPMLWGICFLIVLIRGGGNYSVDRHIGKEV